MQDLGTADFNKYSTDDMDGLLERICTKKGVLVETIGAQQLQAEHTDREPVAHSPQEEDQTSRLGDHQRIRAGAAESCC